MNEINGLSSEIISEIKRIQQEYNIEILIFGSRARGDNKINSDIDIAIKTRVDRNKKYKIMDEFDKIDLAYKIDLVFIQNISNKEFLETIEKEGKAI